MQSAQFSFWKASWAEMKGEAHKGRTAEEGPEGLKTGLSVQISAYLPICTGDAPEIIRYG